MSSHHVPHVETFIPRQYELGPDYRIRVQSAACYMEEAAGNHATALGVGLTHLREHDITWVLAKLRLILHRLPGAGEEVRVVTWPVRVERLQFRRDFFMYGPGDEVLAAAVTQWVLLGLSSRRMERMPGDILRLQPENPPLAVHDADIRVPAVKDGRSGPVFPVRMADIDQNNHVNNSRYMDFILEAAASEGAPGRLAQLDVMFRAESRFGDVIASASAPEADDSRILNHSLFRQSDGQELVRARTVWKEAP